MRVYLLTNASDFNLHGDSSYSFSEVAARHETFSGALKYLVKSNLVKVEGNSSGFLYSININGIECCKKMTSDYSKEYGNSVIKTKEFLVNKTPKEIHEIIYGQLKRRKN